MRKLAFLAVLTAVLCLGVAGSGWAGTSPTIDLGTDDAPRLGVASDNVVSPDIDVTIGTPVPSLGIGATDVVVSIVSNKAWGVDETIVVTDWSSVSNAGTLMTDLVFGGTGTAGSSSVAAVTGAQAYRLEIGGDVKSGVANGLKVVVGGTARSVNFTGSLEAASVTAKSEHGGNNVLVINSLNQVSTKGLAVLAENTAAGGSLAEVRIKDITFSSGAGLGADSVVGFTVKSVAGKTARIVYEGDLTLGDRKKATGGVDTLTFTGSAGRGVFETTGKLTLKNIGKTAADDVNGQVTLANAGLGIIRSGDKMSLEVAAASGSAFGGIENTGGGVEIKQTLASGTAAAFTFVGTAPASADKPLTGTGILAADVLDIIGNGGAAAEALSVASSAGSDGTITVGTYSPAVTGEGGVGGTPESWAGDGIINIRNNVKIANVSGQSLTINAGEIRVWDNKGAIIAQDTSGTLNINANVVVAARDAATGVLLTDGTAATATIGLDDAATNVGGVAQLSAGTTTLAGNVVARGVVAASSSNGDASVVVATGQKFEAGFDIGRNATLDALTSASGAAVSLELGRVADRTNGGTVTRPALDGVLTLRDGGMLKAGTSTGSNTLTLTAAGTGAAKVRGLIQTLNSTGTKDDTAQVEGTVSAADFDADLSGGLLLAGDNDKLTVKNVTQNGGVVTSSFDATPGTGSLTAEGNYVLNSGELSVTMATGEADRAVARLWGVF